MSVRMPDLATKLRQSDFFFDPLQAEIVAEKASSLGHHARLVEKALAALRDFDAAFGSAEDRQALVGKAAHEVWAFLVQRELCGLRYQKEIMRFYDVPPEVLVRLGAVEKR